MIGVAEINVPAPSAPTSEIGAGDVGAKVVGALEVVGTVGRTVDAGIVVGTEAAAGGFTGTDFWLPDFLRTTTLREAFAGTPTLTLSNPTNATPTTQRGRTRTKEFFFATTQSRGDAISPIVGGPEAFANETAVSQEIQTKGTSNQTSDTTR